MCTAGQNHISVEQHTKVQTPTQEKPVSRELRLYGNATDAVILIIHGDLRSNRTEPLSFNSIMAGSGPDTLTCWIWISRSRRFGPFTFMGKSVRGSSTVSRYLPAESPEHRQRRPHRATPPNLKPTAERRTSSMRDSDR